MLKLRTNVPVKINDGITGYKEIILEGRLNLIMINSIDKSYAFNFTYSDLDYNTLTSSTLTLPKNDIDYLYTAVKNSIPSNLPYTDTQDYLHYLGFRLKMAATFKVPVSAIDIVQA